MRMGLMEELKRTLAGKRGGEYDFELVDVVKRNDVVKKSLCIRRKGGNMAANLYEPDLIRKFAACDEDLDQLADYVMNLVENSWVNAEWQEEITKEIQEIRDYSKAREKVLLQIVSGRENREYLKRAVHVPFLDVEICFYFIVGRNGEWGTVPLTKEIFKEWNVSAEEVLEQARKNSARLLPYQFSDIFDVMSDMVGDPFARFMNPPEFEEKGKMYVLTNKNMSLGSATILYEGLMESLSEKMGDPRIAIVPASVHECILIPASGMNDVSHLRDIVREVNDTNVAPEERLSYEVYLYDAEKDQIKIWEDDQDDRG